MIDKLKFYLKVLLVKRKAFVGNHSENCKNISQFISEKDVIALKYESEHLKFRIIDRSLPISEQVAAVKSQQNEYSQKLNDTMVGTLFFVPDKWIYRKLGFKKGSTHSMFK